MVGFTSSACFIHDLTRELMIGKGRKVYNLYVLDSGSLLPASFNNNQNEIVFASFIDNRIWHSHLGHPSMEKIDTLSHLLSLNKYKKTKSFHCNVCPQAKQKCLSFPSDNHISDACFD